MHVRGRGRDFKAVKGIIDDGFYSMFIIQESMTRLYEHTQWDCTVHMEQETVTI